MLVFRAIYASSRPVSLRRNRRPGSPSSWAQRGVVGCAPHGSCVCVDGQKPPSTSYLRGLSALALSRDSRGARANNETSPNGDLSANVRVGGALQQLVCNRREASRRESRRRRNPTLGLFSLGFPWARAAEAPPGRDGRQIRARAHPCPAPSAVAAEAPTPLAMSRPLAIGMEAAAAGTFTRYSRVTEHAESEGSGDVSQHIV